MLRVRSAIVGLCVAVAAALGLAGCGVHDLVDLNAGPLSPRHIVIPLVAFSPDMSDHASNSASVHVTSLPEWVGSPATILVGDVVGNAADEVVIIGPGGFATYSRSGRRLGEHAVDGGLREPGVLIDADDDGKLDVVMGSGRGADAELSSYNGRGRRIASFRVLHDGATFGSIRPIAATAGGVASIAEATWSLGPRGLLLTEPMSLQERWFSMVPTDIVGGVVVGERFAISNRTQQNGELFTIGPRGETRFGFDARPQLLLLDSDGEPAVEVPLAEPRDDREQTAWLLSLDGGNVLVHVEPDAEPGLLQVRDARGTLLVESVLGGVPSMIAVAGRWAVVTVGGRDGWVLSLVNNQLEPVVSLSGAGAPPLPVAVGADESGNASVLAVMPGGIVWLSEHSRRSYVVPNLDEISVARATVGPESVIVVTVSREQLVIVRLPRAGGG